MKLFGFNKKKSKQLLYITENDREWVESNFEWLIKSFGYPSSKYEQVLFNNTNFPNTFKTKGEPDVDAIIKDLSILLQIAPHTKINHEAITDIRDSSNLPYEIQGIPFESDFETTESGYKITYANNLTQYPDRLIYCFVYAFLKIKLTEEKVQFDTGEDTQLFIYLAGVYWGFGIILSQNMFSSGSSSDLFWTTRWNHFSDMPREVMSFSLALSSKLIDQDNPEWAKVLPIGLQELFLKGIALLNESPSKLFNKRELKAIDRFNEAIKEFENGAFENALLLLQEIPSLTNDNVLLMTTYNNIGYYKTRLGLYEESIYYYNKAIEINPDFGYANDNMGYSFLQIGKLEEGKRWIEKAIQTKNNDTAYSHRNLALFYLKSKDYKLSENHFRKAYNSIKIPVDLLDYHYAELLLASNRKEEAILYLKKSLQNGEGDAKQLLKAL